MDLAKIRADGMRAAAVIGVCASLAGQRGTATAADWPNWRGPSCNGVSGETGWKTTWPEGGPKVLWRASVGKGFSAIAVSDGKVYAMGNRDDKDTVYCFDAETGKTLWEHTYPQDLDPKYYEGGTLASPTVAGGKVYTISKDGKTFCLDAGTGKIVWQKDVLNDFNIERTKWGASGSPLISANLVILNVGTRGLALKKDDGSLVWENGKAPGGYATLVPYTAGGKSCVALFGSKEIAGLDAATGKELWRHEWKTKYDVNAADPVIAGDLVFISSGYGTGCALLKIEDAAVREVWRNKNMRNKMNGCVLLQDHIYGVDEGGELRCLEFKTGNRLWSQRGFGQGSLMAADGKLIVLGEKGNLVIAKASPASYEAIASATILSARCWTAPVLANARIYARNAAGNLVCLDVK